ncbi:MAG: MOSC domain-containing protein [Gemmatimonadales bacterium]|jgi:MOSC domain-containing protein YiiM
MNPSVISVNVGLPREVEWRGQRVRTGIWKEPVAGPVRVGKLNLEGDGQADPKVHGGPSKAVYVYPSEHYELWRAELDMPDLDWGGFGENLNTVGVSEAIVRIGDRLRIGTAVFQVTRPRLPCYKLAIRIDRPDIERRFLQSGRTGFYLSVVLEGHVAAGDVIEFVASSEKGPTVAEVVAERATQKAREAVEG